MHKFCKYAKQSFAHVNLALDLRFIVLYAHTNFATTSCKENRHETSCINCVSNTSTLDMIIILETDLYSQITLYYNDNILIYFSWDAVFMSLTKVCKPKCLKTFFSSPHYSLRNRDKYNVAYLTDSNDYIARKKFHIVPCWVFCVLKIRLASGSPINLFQ